MLRTMKNGYYSYFIASRFTGRRFSTPFRYRP